MLAFYASLGMPLPERPPLMLVDGPALNEAESREGRAHTDKGGGAAAQPVFHTRGLTLSQVPPLFFCRCLHVLTVAW